jgi:hypothetical protein
MRLLEFSSLVRCGIFIRHPLVSLPLQLVNFDIPPLLCFPASLGRLPRAGSTGQIGTELVALLRKKHGVNNVIASDLKAAPANFPAGPFTYCDVMDQNSIARIVVDNKIDQIIHLASLLSAIGERNPQLAMQVNARGIENVLEVARLHKVKVFAPSTIAVFGPDTPKENTPNSTIMRPTTIYGTTKVYLGAWMAFAQFDRSFSLPSRSSHHHSLTFPLSFVSFVLARPSSHHQSCSASTTTASLALIFARCGTRASSRPSRRRAAAPPTMQSRSFTRRLSRRRRTRAF